MEDDEGKVSILRFDFDGPSQVYKPWSQGFTVPVMYDIQGTSGEKRREVHSTEVTIKATLLSAALPVRVTAENDDQGRVTAYEHNSWPMTARTEPMTAGNELMAAFYPEFVHSEMFH
jgi:hypothetical protein